MTDSQLPPPEPRDTPATRPPLNLAHMLKQVWGVQTFLAGERKRKETEKKGSDNAR